ncbi:MAG: hypothetical protein LBQ54_03700 [Planctomycetaceae bacterium]|nr:hypothetical protein [Planctomycetaceae bacterium]
MPPAGNARALHPGEGAAAPNNNSFALLTGINRRNKRKVLGKDSPSEANRTE